VGRIDLDVRELSPALHDGHIAATSPLQRAGTLAAFS
jgi:hypothetical protein